MEIITKNLGVWLASLIVALLTIFSDKILGRVRLSLNKADLRVKYFEQMANDLSTYIFWAEIFHECYVRNWLDEDHIAGIGGEVNGAVTTLRTKEYVYRSWAKKYWNSEMADKFFDVMKTVKKVDDAIHEFNNEGNADVKTLALGKELDVLRNLSDDWLIHAIA
jgi:hypothetical protein